MVITCNYPFHVGMLCIEAVVLTGRHVIKFLSHSCETEADKGEKTVTRLLLNVFFILRSAKNLENIGWR